MKKELRAAVVGVGHMGRYHANVYYELPGVELVAVVDLSEEQGKKVAEQYDAVYYKKYEDIYDKVDLVTIAVPTSKHYLVAKEFLGRGISVLLEKPVTNDLSEARELFAIAAKNKAVLHIGQIERFNGAVQELKNVVTEPIMIECRRLGPFNPRINDVGVVMDLMIHDIDIVLNLVDSKVRRINALGISIFTKNEDLANVQLQFENGCIANLMASRVTQHKKRTLTVTQQDKYVVLDYTNQNIFIHRQASSEHFLTKEQLRYTQESFTEQIFVHKDNPLKLEIKHFIECASNGGKRSVSVEKELYSLQIALEVMSELEKNID